MLATYSKDSVHIVAVIEQKLQRIIFPSTSSLPVLYDIREDHVQLCASCHALQMSRGGQPREDNTCG